jgi:hypothetical protein
MRTTLLCLLFSLSAACSARSGSFGTAATDASTDTPSARDDADTKPVDANGWEAPPAPEECSALGPGKCDDCCWNDRPQARDHFWIQVRRCACGQTTPVCQKECGESYCTGDLDYTAAQQKHPKCAPCLDEKLPEECLEPIGQGCASDRQCLEALDCLDLCPMAE